MFVVNDDTYKTLSDKLVLKFGSGIVHFSFSLDIPEFVIKKEIILDFVSYIYSEKDLEFKFLTTLCGVHYPDSDEPLGVVYHFHSFARNLRIRVKSFTGITHPEFPSLTGIHSAANWMERETYDFFGILFAGHPELKRILNVDDMNFFPLRKEFPLEDQTREDKINSFFGR